MTIKKKRELRRYEIEKSPLYRLSNKKTLAGLLNVKLSFISNPEKSGLTGQYKFFVDKNTRRHITEPVQELAVVHRRLHKLLARIALPSYIHSAAKGRSYKTNASAHLGGKKVLRIDIKKFFQSVKFSCVHDFFLRRLACAPDIATILAKICLVETKEYGVHLPTGSCISPVLSFLANQPLFDRISRLSESCGCTFTVYVDDITISGQKANADLLSLVASEIFKRGYRYHKTNVSSGESALITGLMVRGEKLRLPHERSKKIRDLIELVGVTSGSREKLLSSLVGRLSEAEQIEPMYKATRLRVLSKYAADWTLVAEKRAKSSRIARLRRLSRA